MIVVSDTSPVLNLARIGRLELLPLLYDEVLIPSAVYEELTASKHDLPPGIDVALASWLTVATATNHKLVQELVDFWIVNIIGRIASMAVPRDDVPR